MARVWWSMQPYLPLGCVARWLTTSPSWNSHSEPGSKVTQSSLSVSGCQTAWGPVKRALYFHINTYEVPVNKHNGILPYLAAGLVCASVCLVCAPLNAAEVSQYSSVLPSVPGKNDDNAWPTQPNVTRRLPNATPQLPNAVPQLPNATPQLPNAIPQLPNAIPQLPNAVPQLPNATPPASGSNPQMPAFQPPLGLP